MSYTQKDKEFINQRWQQTWNRCREDVDKSEQTLQGYIRELAEIAESQIEVGVLDLKIKDISSYLNKKFIKEDRNVERSIQYALSPKYKQTGTNLETEILRDSVWQLDSESLTTTYETDGLGHYKINGKRVDFVKENHDDVKSEEEKEPLVDKNFNDTTRTMWALQETGSLIERIAEHFRFVYFDNQDVLDKAFNGKKKLYIEHLAKHSNARKEVDKRDKWGDYEKIMSKFLIDTGESTARIAELLNYSSKYGSIGIDRHKEFVDPQTKEFKRKMLEFLMKCPSCNNNIYHIINENIEKHRKGKELEIELPL